MILFNTTFVVHTSATDAFLGWVNDTFIPAAVDSGVFVEPLLTRILASHDPEVVSFAVQFKAHSQSEAERWNNGDAALLMQDLHSRFGENILPFSTFMEIL